MKRSLLYLFAALAAIPASAQKNAAFVAYIDSYKELAIDQMNRHHVPASITLAQAILESAAGQSYLAVAANNHFGIKVGSSWTGPYVTKDDERSNEKFRQYSSPEESYEDHSLFLQKQRYASLFNLAPTDYRGWAYGLKDAGYATNPQYPNLLINLIETYDLAQYDNDVFGHTVKVNNITMPAASDGIITYVEGESDPEYGYQNRGNSNVHYYTHTLNLCNDVVFVRAEQGDSYESIAHEFGTTADKLRRYNDMPAYSQPHVGDIVYLHAKQNHVAPNLRGVFHRVANGESLHSISQRYGIKLKNLYRWNNLPATFSTKVGDLLRLN